MQLSSLTRQPITQVMDSLQSLLKLYSPALGELFQLPNAQAAAFAALFSFLIFPAICLYHCWYSPTLKRLNRYSWLFLIFSLSTFGALLYSFIQVQTKKWQALAVCCVLAMGFMVYSLSVAGKSFTQTSQLILTQSVSNFEKACGNSATSTDCQNLREAMNTIQNDLQKEDWYRLDKKLPALSMARSIAGAKIKKPEGVEGKAGDAAPLDPGNVTSDNLAAQLEAYKEMKKQHKEELERITSEP